MRRPAPSLRWRVAALVSLAAAALGVATVLVAYLAVRSSLRGDLLRALRRDAETVAEIYRTGSGTVAPVGPTGRVAVQLYSVPGGFLTAAPTTYESAARHLPTAAVAAAATGAREWSGELDGAPMLAALTPVPLGATTLVVATLADASFIGETLNRLARLLLAVALALVALSAVTGYLVAGAALRPVRSLARQAARLGPDRLEPVRYHGPPDELGLLARTLNELIGRLGEALDAQRTFLAETSHELRTPLTSLRGFLERGRRRAGPELRRDLDDASRIAGTMSRLVEDLLQLSRGELVDAPAPHLVDPWAEVLVPVAEEFPGVRLSGGPGELVLGDPDRLRQLVRNLAANAVRAAGASGGVELGLEPAGAHVALVVRDEGPGIPEEALPRIFDKFYKGPGGGAGLGLAIVKQIADQHGADLLLESRPGRTEFRVRLTRLDAGDEFEPI